MCGPGGCPRERVVYWILAEIGRPNGITEYFYHRDGTVAPESAGQWPVQAGRLLRVAVRVRANTLNGSSTVTVRVNGADSALAVTYAAAETGVKTDSDEIQVVDGDLISIQVITGGTAGVITFVSEEVVEELD